MEHNQSRNKGLWIATASACVAMIAFAIGVAHANDHKRHKLRTATPIEHVIVIVGENHTFDNVFGGFAPSNGQTVWNLLSEGIIDPDGSPGPNFSNAAQFQATDNGTYSPTPTHGAPYSPLPTPNVTYANGFVPQNVPDPRWASATLANGPFSAHEARKYARCDLLWRLHGRPGPSVLPDVAGLRWRQARPFHLGR